MDAEFTFFKQIIKIDTSVSQTTRGCCWQLWPLLRALAACGCSKLLAASKQHVSAEVLVVAGALLLLLLLIVSKLVSDWSWWPGCSLELARCSRSGFAGNGKWVLFLAVRVWVAI